MGFKIAYWILQNLPSLIVAVAVISGIIIGLLRVKEIRKEIEEIKENIENQRRELNEIKEMQKSQGRELENQGRELNEIKEMQKSQGRELENQRRELNEIKEMQKSQGRELENQRRELNEIKEMQKNQRRELEAVREGVNILSEMQNLIIEAILKILHHSDAEAFSKKIIVVYSNGVRRIFKSKEIKNNPLSDDELDRLIKYIRMGQNMEDFSLEEANDFYQLAQKAKELPLPEFEIQNIIRAATIAKVAAEILKGKK